MNKDMREELLREANARTITAVAQAIRDSFGNLPLPSDSVEIFISAESERLGALLSHDLEMFLLRLKHGSDSIPIVWPLPTHDVYLDPANMYRCRDCSFSADMQSVAEFHATKPLDKPRYKITEPMGGLQTLNAREREAIRNWHGEPRRSDETIAQFQRRVIREVEGG